MESNKNIIIYLVSVDVLKRLLKHGVEKKIIDRLNKINAEKLRCNEIEIA